MKTMRVLRDATFAGGFFPEEKPGQVLIRRFYSPSQDLMEAVILGANAQVNFWRTWLVPSTSAMNEVSSDAGILFHANGDDSTPWNINGDYIGANHGFAGVLELTAPAHGRTVADIGTAWKDAAGTRFYPIRIPGPDTLWLLSEDKSTNAIWKFETGLKGPSLSNVANGTTIAIAGVKLVQLHPCCRIGRQDYLANGQTPLVPLQITDCEFLDIVEDYDIINPGSLLADIIRNPGKKPEYTADRLAGVIRNHIVYRFYPNGANVIMHQATALQSFNLGYMGFIQSAPLSQKRTPFETHDYYIPKSRPFTLDGTNYDFRAIQDFRAPLGSSMPFSVSCKNVEAQDRLPDRFIQFLGNRENGRTRRKVGYATGYSLIHGITVPAERATHTRDAGFIYIGRKSYPSAVSGSAMGNPIPAGTTFDCMAYRQYFDPAAYPNATCVYWHREGDVDVVYADYHQSVERDTIRLPESMTGRKLSIVEKTDSVTLHSTGTVPAAGLSLSVTRGYGSLVLKVERLAQP